MVEAQVDPLEPAKHKHTKVPRGPGSPPVPVLHSPPRKLTVADQQAWKIPPCISNWKNSKGFIIPLDKRLAADGRGLQETTISNKFAMLSESLYIAERKAIQDLNVRNELRKKITLREKEEREQNLREMANRARLERSGISTAGVSNGSGSGNQGSSNDIQNRLGLDGYGSSGSDGSDREEDRKPARREYDSSDAESVESIEAFQQETEEEKQERQQRERLRMERRKEREREMRLDNMKV
jgi:SNW domain-containing protein 1